jgi:hypothetical protein
VSASDPIGGDPQGPIHDLLRLQTDFQQRLASETLRYLRQLQGLVGPAVPGTLVLPDLDFELAGQGQPGSKLTVAVALENRQRVHSLVSPSLSPLVSDAGATWFVEAVVEPQSVLLASGETATASITIVAPEGLPHGTYRGALLLHGFERGALPVRIVIDAPPPSPPAPKRKAKK